MSEFSTELRPLFPDQLEGYEAYLAHGRIADQDGHNRGFYDKGFFNLSLVDENNTILDTLKMWSPSLLSYHPDKYQIRVVRNLKEVIVKSLDRDTISEYISAGEIRCVDKRPFLGSLVYMVGKSGYLLPPRLGIKVFIDGGLEPDQLDQILLDAQEGVRPKDEFLKHLPLIQTEPKYAGQRVMGIFFDNNFAKSKVKEVPDAAVLTEDGHLLGRKVRYPLSPQNWDFLAGLGLVKQPDEALLAEPAST